jgi:hypothetical protein
MKLQNKEIAVFESSMKIDKPSAVAIASLKKTSEMDEFFKNAVNKSGIDADIAKDLLFVSFDVGIANKFNKRDDVVGSETAVKIAERYRHKPGNLEHTKEAIVGHVIDSRVTTMDGGNLTVQEAKKKTDPFNISLAAVVYKNIEPEFSNILERSSVEDDFFYNYIKTSWEVNFSEIYIALGEGDELKDTKIVTNDEEVAELKGFLKAYGGAGYTESGLRVRRILVGEVLPVGFAFTSSPAAAVNGVVIRAPWKEDSNEDESQVFANLVSQTTSGHVTNTEDGNNTPNLKMQKHEQLMKDLSTMLAKNEVSETAVANMTKEFATALKEVDEKYRQESKKISTEAADAKTALEDLTKSVASMKEELSTIKKERDALKEQAAETAKASAIQRRLSALSDKFTLTKEDRAVILEDLKAMDADDDKAFASYETKMSVIMSGKLKTEKNKEAEKVAREAAALATSMASDLEAEDAKAALEALRNTIQTSIANGTSENPEKKTMAEKFNEAFGDKEITIS